MTQATYKDYWVASNAISISLNAMGNPDYAQVSVSSGASIICYMKNVEGLGYDAGHNYRRWQLQAVPTAFGTTGVKYVYVAIPRNDDSKPALVVFPSEIIDIYGKNASETQIGNADYFYINLGGVISASVVSGENQNRSFTTNINTGRLSTDEALNAAAEDAEWYQYSTVTGMVTFTKDIILKAGVKFLNILADIVETAKLKLGGTEVDGIADANTPIDSTTKLVTPSWISGEYLSKKNDDEAEGKIKFHKDIEVLQGVTAGGTSMMYDLRIKNGIQSDEIFDGVSGWSINKLGDASMKSLRLSEFLEVPELRYNRASVYTGIQWQTFGAGIIEEVYPDADGAKTGYCKLKLEKGEIGAIAVGDICMGIYHQEAAAGETDTNETEDVDSKNGNFTFAGFQTIYFRVDKMVDEDGNDLPNSSNNQYFRYTLRAAVDSTYTKVFHPQVGLHFACYANASNSSRQACEYSTTKYRIQLVNMTNWTYDGHNIALIIGQLNGFTIPASRINKTTNQWEDYDYQLTGSGIGFGNAFMWGSMTELHRRDYLLTQQLYYCISNVDPQIFLADPNWQSANWSLDTISPNRTNPFLYTYWRKEYASGSVKCEGPYLAGTDSSVYEVRLSKNVLSMTISNWYDEEDPETVRFSVDANLLCGNITSVIDEATMTSAFENLTYTATISADKKSAHFDCCIVGYVPQEVGGIAPEDNFVTFNLSNEYGSASKSLTIVETRQGEDGADGGEGSSVYTSYVFRRSNTHLTSSDRPTGGSFSTPNPDGDLWSDAIPSGTDPLYMSSRMFTSDGASPQQAEWTAPSLMSDSSDIDFCYSSQEQKPASNTLPVQGSNQDNLVWHNNATGDDIWMAVATLSQGVWSDWQINKVKGETGDDGVSIFTATVFKRSATQVTTAPTGGTFESPTPTDTSWTTSIPSGTESVYMSQRRFASEADSPLNQSAWTAPVLLADSPDMDVCYSSATFKPDSNTLPEKGSNYEDSTWHNDAQEEDIWMAICYKMNGTWCNWQINKIKGENGEPGDDAVVYTVTPNTTSLSEGDDITLSATITKVTGTSSVVNTTIPDGIYVYVKFDDGSWSKITDISDIDYSGITSRMNIGISKKNLYTAATGGGSSGPALMSVQASGITGGTVDIGGGVGYEQLSMEDSDMIDIKTINVIVQGSQGLDGCVIRMMGEWSDTVVYVNQSNSTSDGLRYIDVVQYKVNDEVKYFQRNTITTDATDGDYDAGVLPTNTTFWEAANMFSFIATDLLIAKNAWADILQGAKFYATDTNNVIKAGMQTLESNQDPNEVPQIFAGSDKAGASSAPFRVFQDGTTVATKFKTGVDGCRVEVESGMMKVFGSAGVPNIQFGVDGDGRSILCYYDNDGTLKYNLGPDGIMNATSFTAACYLTIQLSLLSDTVPVTGKISAFSYTTYYQFSDATKKVADVTNYSATAFKDNVSDWSLIHTSYNLSYFTYGGTKLPSVNTPCSGWYATNLQPLASQDDTNASGVQMKRAYFMYSTGRKTKEGIIYYKINNGQYVLCNASGTTYTNGGSIDNYFIWNGSSTSSGSTTKPGFNGNLSTSEE